MRICFVKSTIFHRLPDVLSRIKQRRFFEFAKKTHDNTLNLKMLSKDCITSLKTLIVSAFNYRISNTIKEIYLTRRKISVIPH
jgi:hypothetical protein